MKFDLRKNSYNFINEALFCAKRGNHEVEKYAFAILHLTQGLELALKSLLYDENKVLIYDNIDNPNINKTISINNSLKRLISFGIIEVSKGEKLRIEKIINFRNKITHSVFELNEMQAKDSFIRLFEFLHYFFSKYLNIDLHEIISKELWEFEAELLSQMKRSDFVHYFGIEVHKNHPKDIVKIQKYNGILIDEHEYYRIPFGKETTFKLGNKVNCGDCGVKKGFYHTGFCDYEQCPKCGEQLIGFHKCDVVDYMTIK